MVKYRQIKISKTVFDLTKSKESRNIIPENKYKLSDMKSFSKSRILSNIIHKIRIFDLLIFTAILIVLASLIYSRIQRKSRWINIRLSVQNYDWWYQSLPPSYWYASSLKAGDFANDSLGSKTAEVVNVDNYDFGNINRTIYFDMKVKAVFDKRRQQYLYEFKPLVIGSAVSFNFPGEKVVGLVIKLEDIEIPYFYKTITIQKRVIPQLADKIKIGDKSYDANNNLVAEVINIKKEYSSNYEFSDIRGQIIKVYNKAFRDAEITLKIKAFRALDRDYFVIPAPIKIGSQVRVEFPEYSLEEFVITQILN